MNKREVRYPFSILRVYFYLIGGILTLILSIPILIDIYSDTFIILTIFSFLSVLVIYASLRLKLYLLEKMEESEGILISPNDIGKRKFSLMVFFIVLALFLPVGVFAILEADTWFLGLVCFVVGFCLSEPILYFFYRKRG